MARGVRFGRPAKLTDEQRVLSERLLGEGMPAREVARTFCVHRATIYRAVARRPSVDAMNDLLTIALEAHNDEHNHHRRYEISVGRGLLGDWMVTLRYGRAGQGRASSVSFSD